MTRAGPQTRHFRAGFPNRTGGPPKQSRRHDGRVAGLRLPKKILIALFHRNEQSETEKNTSKDPIEVVDRGHGFSANADINRVPWKRVPLHQEERQAFRNAAGSDCPMRELAGLLVARLQRQTWGGIPVVTSNSLKSGRPAVLG